MPRLTLLLILGLLASRPPAGVILHSLADLLTSNSGWEMDRGGPPAPDPSPNSGWEMDPDG